MKKNRWDFEKMKAEALKYKSRSQLKRENYPLYRAAWRHGVWKEITTHMPISIYAGKPALNRKWHEELLYAEALKYKTRTDFQKKSVGAYKSAYRRKLLDRICSHMEEYDSKKRSKLKTRWTKERIIAAANTCTYRSEFKEKFATAYIGARRMKILSKCCKHMKYKSNSTPEMDMKQRIRKLFPEADTLKIRGIKVDAKPHIKGFDIDVYIKSLKKGVEFDGDYHHSLSGLRRSRPHWPIEDIENYHKIKDLFFKVQYGIEILHIKEKEWNKNKKKCLKKIESFLKKNEANERI